MNPTESLISLGLQAVIGVAAAVAAYYGYRNHQVGTNNSAKIDKVQATTDGAAHALASNLATSQAANEDVIRALAASTITPKPPQEGQ